MSRPKVTYQLVDPTKHPELAERYKVTVMNTTHIQYGNDETGSGTNVSDMSEQAITNGIVKVTKTAHKTVCFLTGEGEADPDDASAEAEWASSRIQCSVKLQDQLKLIWSPRKGARRLQRDGGCRPDTSAGTHEIDALSNYLKGGGRALSCSSRSRIRLSMRRRS